MNTGTITAWLDRWAEEFPERTWLRDRQGDAFTAWTWRAAHAEVAAIAAWLERSLGARGSAVALLSRNRAHWMLADMAVIASGNVSVPLFTTLGAEPTRYVLETCDAKLLIVGEAENWERVRAVVPQHLEIVALPGVDPGRPCRRWTELLRQHRGQEPLHHCRHHERVSIVFTSGTTGAPKGVLQTHDSMLIPMRRAGSAFATRQHARFLSYLPLAHLAERQLVWIQSLLYCGEVQFNEALPVLIRDMVRVQPTFFFGAPRIWEQLQQSILSSFGSQQALKQALRDDARGTTASVRMMLGFQDTDYLLTAAAPTPASLIRWYESLGITLMEGYGQSEAMCLIGNMAAARRVGSVGRPLQGVQVRISEAGELLCRADGLSPGYHKMPAESAQTFVDGWVHTGDKATVDADGFYYITGRVKDYFKTIHGKYVAPVPIECEFARNPWVEQQCLLGRGYAKCVMVCVLSGLGQRQARETLEDGLRSSVEQLNQGLDRHARLGAVIVSAAPWTVENGILTPTLKIRRDTVEACYGGLAQALAQDAASRGELKIAFADA